MKYFTAAKFPNLRKMCAKKWVDCSIFSADSDPVNEEQ